MQDLLKTQFSFSLDSSKMTHDFLGQSQPCWKRRDTIVHAGIER